MQFPVNVCIWCTEENPTENHKMTCAETFKPRKFVTLHEWISVKDRLPEHSWDEYILLTNNKENWIVPGWFSNNMCTNEKFYTANPGSEFHRQVNPTHWMPLSELLIK